MVVTSMACNGRLIGMSAGDDSGLLREGTDTGQGYNRMVILRRKAEGRGQERNLSATKSEDSTYPACTVWERLSAAISAMEVVFDYPRPRILNQVSFAGADLIRDKTRRLNLPGKHMVGAASSRDICDGCCIRLSATRHSKSGVVCRSRFYPRQSQKIQLTR